MKLCQQLNGSLVDWEEAHVSGIMWVGPRPPLEIGVQELQGWAVAALHLEEGCPIARDSQMVGRIEDDLVEPGQPMGIGNLWHCYLCCS